MFTFVVLDGDANLPQHLLVYLADRRAQRPDGRRGVEVEDRHKIFMAEILLRFQPAAGHEGICVTLWHMSISSGVVVAITFQQIDDAPHAETGTESDNEGLENGDCLIKKFHK